jgi:hypothetical protein
VTRPQIKGAAIRALLDWHRREYGADAYEAVLAQLSEQERAMLSADGEVLASVWYDARLSHRLLELVLGVLPPSQQPLVARDAAREALRHLRRGVYQFVVQQIVSPAFYARHIQRLFRLLHDTGERRIEMGPPGMALSITCEWPGHHPLLCTLANETMAAVFETLGCRDVSIEPLQCVSRGAPDCRCQVRWKA